jgi:hypothetical protein
LLLAPDMMDRVAPLSPGPATKSSLPARVFLALIAAGLLLAAAYPLAWRANVTNPRLDE